MKPVFQPLAHMVAKTCQLIGQKFNALTKPATKSPLQGAVWERITVAFSVERKGVI